MNLKPFYIRLKQGHGKIWLGLSEGKQLFISTHNIDFIRGVLEDSSGLKHKIDSMITIHLIDNDILKKDFQ